MSLSNPSGKLQDYFKFTFCRNPYSRVVSNYIMFTTSRNIKIDEFRINQICQFHNNPSSMSFSEFLEFICKYDNHHWQPQIDFVYGYDVDFIGRVENYQEDFNTICDKIGIPRQELLHKNKSKHKHYTEYYDDETREIVAEKYKKDIEYFGYKFGE
jgi:chondroitin 4-sulfotransferase 11